MGSSGVRRCNKPSECGLHPKCTSPVPSQMQARETTPPPRERPVGHPRQELGHPPPTGKQDTLCTRNGHPGRGLLPHGGRGSLLPVTLRAGFLDCLWEPQPQQHPGKAGSREETDTAASGRKLQGNHPCVRKDTDTGSGARNRKARIQERKRGWWIDPDAPESA